MATTQYIGSRYVPLFADPAEWNNTRAYEPLTIVLHEGNSYTSKQYVPVGIDIANGDYWALTGNYNAQVEQYRKEVANYDARITTADGTANNALSLAQTNEQDIATLDAQMAGTQDSVLKSEIEKLQLATSGNILVFGDSWTADGVWVSYLQQQVKHTIKNYAVSGAGYTNVEGMVGGQFLAQVKTAHASETNVDAVIVYGGLNDIRLSATTSQVYSAATDLFNTIHSFWPNARIITGLNVSNEANVVSVAPKYSNFIATSAANANACNVNSLYWLSYVACGWDDINVHPDSAGKKQIAVCWCNAIFGGETTRTVNMTWENKSNYSLDTLNGTAIDGNIFINGYIVVSDVKASEDILTLQKGTATSGYDMVLSNININTFPVMTVQSSGETKIVGALVFYGATAKLFISSEYVGTGMTLYISARVNF